MRTHFNLSIDWKDEEGNSPCVEDRETLKLYALRQIAEDIGRGELNSVGRGDIDGPGRGSIDGPGGGISGEGKMERKIVRQERESYYYGEWKLEEGWQLTQEKHKKIVEGRSSLRSSTSAKKGQDSAGDREASATED